MEDTYDQVQAHAASAVGVHVLLRDERLLILIIATGKEDPAATSSSTFTRVRVIFFTFTYFAYSLHLVSANFLILMHNRHLQFTATEMSIPIASHEFL